MQCSGIRNRARSGALLHSRICISFACCLCGARPSPASWHMVTSQGRGGHILYTPHGHTDSRSPGGTAGRVRSSTTKKGVSHGHSAVRGKDDDFLPVAAGAGHHEMWSVCRCWAGPGASPSLASGQCSGDSVLALYILTQLLYLDTLCTIFCQLIDVFDAHLLGH